MGLLPQHCPKVLSRFCHAPGPCGPATAAWRRTPTLDSGSLPRRPATDVTALRHARAAQAGSLPGFLPGQSALSAFPVLFPGVPGVLSRFSFPALFLPVTETYSLPILTGPCPLSSSAALCAPGAPEPDTVSSNAPGMLPPSRGRSATALAILLTMLLAIVPASALFLAPGLARQAHAGVPVRAAIVLNMTTGRILYQKNADMRIPPASLTKLMTSFLVHDALSSGKLQRSTKVRVSREAARVGGSSMNLRAGETVTIAQLLEGAIISSGNDAATALAIKVSGRQRNFVNVMNARARRLGMKSTVFKNPTGLPAAGQLTTARDMMRLAVAYLKRHPSAARIHAQRSYHFHRRLRTTTNPFLGSRGVTGLKTGFTQASGYNIILTAERGKNKFLIVLLGARTKNRRSIAGAELLTAAFKYPNNARLFRQAVDGTDKRTLTATSKKAIKKKPQVRKNPKKQPPRKGKTRVRQSSKR